MTLPKVTETPETRPYPINLVMTPMEGSKGIEIGIIFNGRSEPEYLNYVQGFYDAPFYFYFDVRGDALIIVVRWGSGKASRWVWGHVTPHDRDWETKSTRRCIVSIR